MYSVLLLNRNRIIVKGLRCGQHRVWTGSEHVYLQGLDWFHLVFFLYVQEDTDNNVPVPVSSEPMSIPKTGPHLYQTMCVALLVWDRFRLTSGKNVIMAVNIQLLDQLCPACSDLHLLHPDFPPLL